MNSCRVPQTRIPPAVSVMLLQCLKVGLLAGSRSSLSELATSGDRLGGDNAERSN